MATVLQFPVKKELPKEMEERLQKAAIQYVTVLDELITDLNNIYPNEEDFEEMTGLVLNTLLECIIGAIEVMGES